MKSLLSASIFRKERAINSDFFNMPKGHMKSLLLVLIAHNWYMGTYPLRGYLTRRGWGVNFKRGTDTFSLWFYSIIYLYFKRVEHYLAITHQHVRTIFEKAYLNKCRIIQYTLKLELWEMHGITCSRYSKFSEKCVLYQFKKVC